MTVGPVRPGMLGNVERGRMRRPGGGFALPASGSDSAAEAAAAGAAAPPSFLSLQEAAGPPPAEERAARARRQAAEALDDLRDLQLGLLGMEEDPAALERLARMAAARGDGLDPALSALMAELGLRARVELARRGRR
jgi:hypothetical protein